MTADLRFVTHTAERHAHELAIDRIRDRAPERSLADAGRADEAQDRPLQLFHARLHRQVFDDAFLDFLQPVVILVELGLRQIQIDHGLAALRSEEHTSELQSLMRISYAVFCLKKKNNTKQYTCITTNIDKHEVNTKQQSSTH